VLEVLGMERPAGCRTWGPNDVAEVHRQIETHGLEHVQNVVRFLYVAIETKRKFDEWTTQPRDWSSLWKYDGDAWCRWDQRYAEAMQDESIHESKANGAPRVTPRHHACPTTVQEMHEAEAWRALQDESETT
jgi:hypothetical protein